MPERVIDPISLGIEIRRLLENEMGEMGVLTYKKQCWDIGLNPDRIAMKDVTMVARGVARAVSPIVGHDRSKKIEKSIVRFKIMAEMSEASKETDPLAKARKMTNLSLALGDIEAMLDEHDLAEKYYKQALRDAQKANMPILESKAYRGLGHIHRTTNAWEEAFKWFKKAMDLSSTIGDNLGKVDAFRGIGRVYWNEGKFDKALDSYLQAMEISEKINDKEVIGITFIDIGNVYNEKGKLDKAEECYTKAVPFLEEKKNFRELARAYNNVGDLMLQRKEWEKAIDYFQKCKVEAERVLADKMT
ncbi:MAG: tetratricopeptide repeat protein, partial [Thermoplasmata archaeon]|nr:tetratricopeptide repeat protein [Thermoplasmata archaeon]